MRTDNRVTTTGTDVFVAILKRGAAALLLTLFVACGSDPISIDNDLPPSEQPPGEDPPSTNDPPDGPPPNEPPPGVEVVQKVVVSSGGPAADTLFWEGTLTGGTLSWTRVHPTPRLQTRFKRVITFPAAVPGSGSETETVAIFAGGTGADGLDSGSQVAIYRAGSAPVTGLNMREARANHALAMLSGNRVLITGGVGPGLAEPLLATSEIFDPQTRTFLPTGSMRFQRAYHAANTLPDGRVLVTGGVVAINGDAHAASNTAEIYDPSQGAVGAFVDSPPMHFARRGHSVVHLNDGRLLIVGGNTILEAEVYTPSTGLFSVIGKTISVHAYGHSATRLPDGKVLIAGGDSGGENPSAAAEIFDPTLNIFIPVGSMTVARMYHFAVLLDDGTVLIGGGIGPDGTPLSSTERFDPATNTFTPMTPMPGGTYNQAVAVVKGPV